MRNLVLLFLLGAVASCGPNTEVEDAVRAQLKDPKSAEFRGLREVSGNIDGVQQRIVCGEVNARGSQGGYVGFTHFIYGKQSKTALVGSPEGVPDYLPASNPEYQHFSQVERIWNAWCG